MDNALVNKNRRSRISVDLVHSRRNTRNHYRIKCWISFFILRSRLLLSVWCPQIRWTWFMASTAWWSGDCKKYRLVIICKYMQSCRKCGKSKRIEDFYKTYSYVRKVCKSCEHTSKRKYGSSLKLRAVELLGGKCKRCGYKRCIQALEFDHLRDKEFKPSEMFRFHIWDKIVMELEKCQLLCANCHREKTFTQWHLHLSIKWVRFPHLPHGE